MSYWTIKNNEMVQEDGPLIRELEIANLGVVRCLKPGSVVLDIGAFIGDTAEIFLRQGCIVYSFEPYLDTYECLLANTNWAGLRAKNFMAIVGDGNVAKASGILGEQTLGRNLNKVNLGNRIVEWADVIGATHSLRIDDLAIPKVDFIKIDVEGSEPRVLDGLADTIERCKPLILCECYDSMLKIHGFDRRDLLRRLMRFGYRCEPVIGATRNDRLDYLAYP